MDKFAATRLRQRRAKALSVWVIVAMLSGLAPMSSQADDHEVAVTATVAAAANCVVSITTNATVDLGTPTVDNVDSFYVFLASDGITATWSAAGGDCAGALHAEHLGFLKDGSTGVSSPDAWLGLDDQLDAAIPYEIPSGSTTQVATSSGLSAGDSNTFDVIMRINPNQGAGTFSSKIRFTVVVGP